MSQNKYLEEHKEKEVNWKIGKTKAIVLKIACYFSLHRRAEAKSAFRELQKKGKLTIKLTHLATG